MVDIVVVTLLASFMIAGVLADAVLDDGSTLLVRASVLVISGATALFWWRARAYAGVLIVVLAVSVAAASAVYALFAEPVTVANEPTTAEFAVEACRLQSTSVIEANQGVTVIFLLAEPVESGKPMIGSTLAVSGTALTAIQVANQPCERGAGGSLVTIRVNRGDGSTTAKDFVRGLETASAIHVLPGLKPKPSNPAGTLSE